MNKELELWQFVADRLQKDHPVMLLAVAESSGSSPGRQGYKMAVGVDGMLIGSIGGGVMEVNLVEQSRAILSEPLASAGGQTENRERSGLISDISIITEQVHRKNSAHASGMICSGKQTVIFRLLTRENANVVGKIVESLKSRTAGHLRISTDSLSLASSNAAAPNPDFAFERRSETEFTYLERLGFKNDLYIIGGGHCALALSDLMSKLDFHISLFDDRPELNTIEKNRFAHNITIIDGYEQIAAHIPSGDRIYVVVMTLGYVSDSMVIRQLLDRDFRYFGVLGQRG